MSTVAGAAERVMNVAGPLRGVAVQAAGPAPTGPS